MDSLFDMIHVHGLGLLKAGRFKIMTGLYFLAGIALALVGVFLSIDSIAVLTGSIAGVIWLSVGYLIWDVGLSKELHDKLDFRGNWLIAKRRWAVAWVTLGWIAFLGLAGHWMPRAILGALNVAVLLTLWRIASTTSFERRLIGENEIAQAIWAEEDGSDENSPQA